MLLLSKTSRAPRSLASSAAMARLSRYSRSRAKSTRCSKSTFIRPGAGVSGRAGTGGMGATIEGSLSQADLCTARFNVCTVWLSREGDGLRSRRRTRPPPTAGARAAGPVRARTGPADPVLAQPDLTDRARPVRAVGRHAVRAGHRAAHVAGLPVRHRPAK